MSKIMEFAAEIEGELQKIKNENSFLANELKRAREKNKQVVYLIYDFLSQMEEVMNRE